MSATQAHGLADQVAQWARISEGSV